MTSHAYPVLTARPASKGEFVKFWAATYRDSREHLYNDNIGRQLTEPGRILALFEWKNGGSLSGAKMASVHRNFIQAPRCPAPKAEDAIDWLCQPGGVVWRIFWLHCNFPDVYPIYDQHVYRAMRYLTVGATDEIPEAARAKAISYVEEYRPFYDGFSGLDKRRVDQALWAFGRFLTTPYKDWLQHAEQPELA